MWQFVKVLLRLTRGIYLRYYNIRTIFQLTQSFTQVSVIAELLVNREAFLVIAIF